MKICVNVSLEFFREEQKTGYTKPAILAYALSLTERDEERHYLSTWRCPLQQCKLKQQVVKHQAYLDSTAKLRRKTKEKIIKRRGKRKKRSMCGWVVIEKEKPFNESKLLRFYHSSIYGILGIFSAKLSHFQNSNTFQEPVLALARKWL